MNKLKWILYLGAPGAVIIYFMLLLSPGTFSILIIGASAAIPVIVYAKLSARVNGFLSALGYILTSLAVVGILYVVGDFLAFGDVARYAQYDEPATGGYLAGWAALALIAMGLAGVWVHLTDAIYEFRRKRNPALPPRPKGKDRLFSKT